MEREFPLRELEKNPSCPNRHGTGVSTTNDGQLSSTLKRLLAASPHVGKCRNAGAQNGEFPFGFSLDHPKKGTPAKQHPPHMCNLHIAHCFPRYESQWIMHSSLLGPHLGYTATKSISLEVPYRADCLSMTKMSCGRGIL